jgi:hypothetical protein
MKLADLQLATELQAALARLDSIPPGCALLEANGLDLELTAAELASFIAWRRAELHRQLRALGVEPEGGDQEQGSGIGDQGSSESPRQAAVPAVASPRQVATSRAVAMRMATERVLQGPIEDLANGLIDQKKFDEFANRRHAQIHDLADALMRGEEGHGVCQFHAGLGQCGAPATTVIDGLPYCETHSAEAPRRERPSFLRMLGR